ncbi:LacI family DNA-binding transcriptional regulator [Prauserella cavernicola]|uniref:LacI family DNA-binding transcriptional regulator n=1 Tax=Prauserella cavernicola TaxID=2800127 RepID=A0A934V422_9PSEU|nr:LacI family DNA-binding transcriptional regulator [Prauserella cavernicola]MBK1787901.1 LacI family DNA-binding transcriptional regulator [Prauserella cavernicola]
MQGRSKEQPHRPRRQRGGVRLADVAAAAQVSAPLASRVLNADPNVRATPETKARVLEAAEQLGYVPNIAAKTLRQQRTGLLGLVVHNLSSPIYLDLLQGARTEAAANNYFLVLGDVDELLTDDEAYRIFINGKRVDGLIVQGGHGEFDQRIAEIARALPTVIVNAPPKSTDTVAPLVAPDEVAATRMLTEHLLALGHARIGLISGPHDSPTNLLREQGVRDALAEAGHTLRDEDTAHLTWSAEAGRAGLRTLAGRWENTRDRPTALIGGNSLIGIGMLRAAAELDIAVPGDLSIAAVHDTWISEHLVPSLTTVSLPLREMGETAVRLLLTDTPRTQRTIISDPPPRLHARASTAIAREH